MIGWGILKRGQLKVCSWGILRPYRSPSLLRKATMANITNDEAQIEEDTATVRSLPDSNEVSINLTLAGQARFMSRSKEETLAKTLGRIRLNAQPRGRRLKNAKKLKANPEADVKEIEVELLQGIGPERSPIPGDTLNKDAWLQGTALRVGEKTFDLIINPPTLEKLLSYGTPMVGFPSCGVAQVQFADEGDCEWQWSKKLGDKGDWEVISEANKKVYVPQERDEGSCLRVCCKPVRYRRDTGQRLQGEALTTYLGIVSQGPSVKPGDNRHPLTQQALSPPRLRVATYNILADQYVGTTYAQEVLFSYCPHKYRDASYRHPQILHEILGFNADLICLQEVDEKAFEQFFRPQMEFAGKITSSFNGFPIASISPRFDMAKNAGFHGFYTNKAGGQQREGEATFFRSSRYHVVINKVVKLNKALDRGLKDDTTDDLHKQIRPILQSSAQLPDHLRKVSTVAQLTIVAPIEASDADHPVCIVNTHLFYHPRANHIRTIHTAAIMAEADALMDEAMSSKDQVNLLRGERPALLLCGDLNSGLNKGFPGCLELLASGHLSSDYWDWQSGKSFRFVKDHEDTPEEAAGEKASVGREVQDAGFRAAELTIPFQLASADSFRTPFTNYVKGYQGALDYVFYERNRMAVVREIPLPSSQELQGWIPSRRFPSDHMCPELALKEMLEILSKVVFDLEWKSTGQNKTEVSPPPRPPVNSRVFEASEENIVHGLVALGIGGVIAVPTDTLYGLASAAELAEGVQTLYNIKRRDRGLPLAICVADAGMASRYGESSHLPEGLLENLLPGPVTLLLNRKGDSPLAAELNPGVQTIGLRVPDNRFIQKLCHAYGGAIALTSANVSGSANSLEVEDFRELWPRCAVIYNGGTIEASPSGSTIVDLSVPGRYKIIRPGVAEEATIAILKNNNLSQRQ